MKNAAQLTSSSKTPQSFKDFLGKKKKKSPEIIILAANRLCCSSVLPLRSLIAKLACSKPFFSFFFLNDLCLPWVDGSFYRGRGLAPAWRFLCSLEINFEFSPEFSALGVLWGLN